MDRKLYKLTVKSSYGSLGEWFVVAETSTGAEKYLLLKYKEWDYTTSAYVSNIELICSEGQHGNPEALLFAEEAPDAQP